MKVSAAFLLFPETIEIDVDSRKKRSVEDSFLTPGLCGGSSSKICRVLEKILLSIVRAIMFSTTQSIAFYCPGLCRGGEVRGGPAGRVPGVPDHGLHAAALRHSCHGRQVRVSGLCLARDQDPITDIMAALTARKPAPKSQFIVPSHSLQPPC